MSLNRSEQLLFDYVQRHPEERQFWQSKVQNFVRTSNEVSSAVAKIDAELWRYYKERASVVPAFVEALRVHGTTRTSMKNLAELWVRLWTEPKTRKASDPNSQDA